MPADQVLDEEHLGIIHDFVINRLNQFVFGSTTLCRQDVGYGEATMLAVYVKGGFFIDATGAILPLSRATVARIDGTSTYSATNMRLLDVGLISRERTIVDDLPLVNYLNNLAAANNKWLSRQQA